MNTGGTSKLIDAIISNLTFSYNQTTYFFRLFTA